jgi:hypothetical protein
MMHPDENTVYAAVPAWTSILGTAKRSSSARMDLRPRDSFRALTSDAPTDTGASSNEVGGRLSHRRRKEKSRVGETSHASFDGAAKIKGTGKHTSGQ